MIPEYRSAVPAYVIFGFLVVYFLAMLGKIVGSIAMIGVVVILVQAIRR